MAVVTYAVSTPLLTAVGDQLVHEDQPERVDAMIVLAPWLDRVLEAAELYRSGYAPVILLTREVRQPAEEMLIERGIVRGTEETRRSVLVALGVPSAAVTILDGFVGSTADEAWSFAEWARHRPVRSVMVVTSPHHTGRARLAFLRAVERLGIKVIVRPSKLTRFEGKNWWRARDTLRDGFLEWQKLLYYRLVELPRMTPPERPS